MRIRWIILGLIALLLCGVYIQAVAYHSSASKPYDAEEEPWEEVDDASLQFLAQYTNTNDMALVRANYEKWKADLQAKQVFIYGCIKYNSFLTSRIARHKDYSSQVLPLVQSEASFKIADIGCLFGTDIRKLIIDGAPPDALYCIDVDAAYWKSGYDLFGDEEPLQVNTVFTDVSQPNFDRYQANLIGVFDVVHSGAVLHLFAKDEGEIFLRNIYHMLKKGGLYIGNCGVALKPTQTGRLTLKTDKLIYIHSTESLAVLLREVGFVEVTVEITQKARPAGLKFGITWVAAYSARKP